MGLFDIFKKKNTDVNVQKSEKNKMSRHLKLSRKRR